MRGGRSCSANRGQVGPQGSNPPSRPELLDTTSYIILRYGIEWHFTRGRQVKDEISQLSDGRLAVAVSIDWRSRLAGGPSPACIVVYDYRGYLTEAITHRTVRVTTSGISSPLDEVWPT